MLSEMEEEDENCPMIFPRKEVEIAERVDVEWLDSSAEMEEEQDKKCRMIIPRKNKVEIAERVDLKRAGSDEDVEAGRGEENEEQETKKQSWRRFYVLAYLNNMCPTYTDCQNKEDNRTFSINIF